MPPLSRANIPKMVKFCGQSTKGKYYLHAVVIDVALLDVIEETVLPFVSFQKRMMLYSISRRNAEINDVNCWMSIIDQNTWFWA